ncbi:MAG: hypothetical protein KAI72_06870, partial [Candidatus Pacebacteria bacterium]|nr:hypothetical protein [Candidatus Paceibacterota bacterium]
TARMGGAGNIYTKAAAQTNGDLIIDNNDNDNADETYMGKTPLLTSDWTFDNLTISGAGKLDANGYNLTINADFNNTGTFTHSDQTVTFADSTQTSRIYGDTTFNNFTCATAGKALQFEATKTTTITGALTFTGQSGSLITLRSTSDDTQWLIDPQGTRSVSYVDVKDSNNVHATAISPENSTDSLNNINWDFVSMDHFTITGNPTQTVGDFQTITVTAIGDDSGTYTDYTGDHDLTFSGANISPNSNDPTCEDKDSTDINFGTATSLTFTAGVAITTMKLYTAESAEIETTDGTLTSDGDANDLNVTVSSPLSEESIVINSNDTYTNTASTTLTLSATNANQMKFSNDNLTYSTYEGYNTSKTWDITDASYGGNTNNELKTTYAIFNDTYGNEATAVSDTITYDTAPPTGAIVLLTSILADSITANVSGATDTLSGLASTPYNFQNITNSASSSYQSETSWVSNSLTPNTQYSFRVGYRDNANNETQSLAQSAYTLANIPTPLSLTVNSTSEITANWNNNSNPIGTEYYIENTTKGTNSGWIT